MRQTPLRQRPSLLQHGPRDPSYRNIQEIPLEEQGKGEFSRIAARSACGSARVARVTCVARRLRGNRDLNTVSSNGGSIMPRPFRVAVIGRTSRGNFGHGLDIVSWRMRDARIVAVADEMNRAAQPLKSMAFYASQ